MACPRWLRVAASYTSPGRARGPAGGGSDALRRGGEGGTDGTDERAERMDALYSFGAGRETGSLRFLGHIGDPTAEGGE